jgi:D-alanine-D-alanine ligase
MSRALKIALLMDEGWIPADDPDLSGPDREGLTERHVAMALRELGHRVRVVGVGHDVHALVGALLGEPTDVVFNLAEQFRNDRRLDAHVAGLLEMLHLPYTGAGPAGLMICRDKGLCKQLLGLHKVHCPAFVAFVPRRRLRVPKHLAYPLIVKPRFEDASDGIARTSIVHDEQALTERVRFVHEQWGQVAIAEEYVEGRELYVGVLGNERLQVFPARELRFGAAADRGPQIATRRVKTDHAYRQKWGIAYDFAELPEDVAERIARVSRRVYRLLQLRDYGRIDFRLTPAGRLHVLEANPNPEIAFGEDLAEAAERAGVGYNALIGRIVRLALRRSAAG